MMINSTEVMRCEVTGISSINIPILWEQITPFIQSALAHSEGEYWLADIYQSLMYHKMQLWVVVRGEDLQACLITEFRNFPRKKVCYIVLAAGTDVKEWTHCFGEIEQWAYEEGADLIQSFARPGWKGLAEERGYHVKYHLYCKELHLPDGITH